MVLDTLYFRFYVKFLCDECGTAMDLGVEALYKDIEKHIEYYDGHEVSCVLCDMVGDKGVAKFVKFASHSEQEQEEEANREEDEYELEYIL